MTSQSRIPIWLISCGLILGSQICHSAESDSLQILPLNSGPDSIPNLVIMEKTAKIEVVSGSGGENYFVTVHGNFGSDDWSLLKEKEKISLSEKHEFTLKIPVTGETSNIELTGISPFGEIKYQTVSAAFPEWKSFLLKRKPPASVRRFFFTPSLGFTYVSYSQTGFTPFNETALTAKAGAIYYLSSRWDLEATAFFTALPMSTTVPNSQIRYLGVNGRFGYVLPWIRAPWRLSIMTGVYYTTTFVPNSTFGFENMTGPQLYPVLTRGWGNHGISTFYFKFSPVTNQLTPLSISNREIAGGTSYGFHLSNGHKLSITLDIASLQLNFNNIQISSQTYSLGIGYGL